MSNYHRCMRLKLWLNSLQYALFLISSARKNCVENHFPSGRIVCEVMLKKSALENISSP